MIKETYREVEITYREEQNEWRAEGYRPKESLKAMREAIDRHLDKPEAKKRNKVEAIRKEYERPERVTITSVAEDGSVWYQTAGGERKKQSYRTSQMFYALDANSEAAFNRWSILQKEIEKLKEKQKKELSNMKLIDLSTL